MEDKLNAGDGFPSLTLRLAGGKILNVPEDLDSKYTMILFYRGHW